MSENKQRQGTRLQNSDWEENPGRVNDSTRNQYSSYDEDREENVQSEPRLIQGRNYPNEYYGSNQGYPNTPLYRSQQQLQEQSRYSRNYGQQVPAYNSRGYENPTPYQAGNYGQDLQGNYGEYAGPYGYQRRYYVTDLYNPNMQQQPGNNNPGRWNENIYRENQAWEGVRYGQHSNTGGVNTPGAERIWNSPAANSMSINEQGKLFSSGPYKGKGPKGYHRSDDRIKEEISDRMMDDGQLDASDIAVEVDNNEVVLTGSVDNREAKRRAEDIAESISGVNNVENHLRINQGMERRNAGLSSTGSDPKNKRSSLAGSAS